ncbi:hypothetical protein EV195_101506 [Tenacibaculum skagerrakense]|uniref:Uncharacterized protein n=1 Tax=Tenacibaculum skagerrakense TaxID=186571 RepID=A0A4R2P122_9FLAO|nr:hypothetical protein [Tenacibaculum skagerrakense]TCP28330.1 hypothetical protein EV195_101506 [Tenacibaculum skagerrakense]
MTFKLTTYKTLTGEKQILETKTRKSTEAVVYENNQPAYLVDCFDLQTESNVQMNYLVLCQQRSMKNVIEEIGEKNNVNLTVKEAPLFSIKKSSEDKDIELPPLPIEWVN